HGAPLTFRQRKCNSRKSCEKRKEIWRASELFSTELRKQKAVSKVSMVLNMTTISISYIIRSRNGDRVFKGMPAHVQNLLVKVNRICIGLLPHSVRPQLLVASVHWHWYSDLLRLESRLVRL